jgi:nucleoside-diphosphate-sugar epimerase
MQIEALVVGATGIVGRGLCQALLDQGASVQGVSRTPRVSFQGRSTFLPTCSLVPWAMRCRGCARRMFI